MMNARTAWKTPGQDDAYAFAFTECAEAVDAYLREIGGFARNNHRTPTVVEELADTGMMLMTGLGREFQYSEQVERPNEDIEKQFLLKYIAGFVLEAWKRVTGADAEMYAEWGLCEITHYLGMNFAAELEKRMARIEAKQFAEASQ